MQKQPLSSTTLKADKAQAEKISASLLGMNKTLKSGKPAIRREDTETGFRILCPMTDEEGKAAWSVFFEYSKTDIGERVDFDPRIVTIN